MRAEVRRRKLQSASRRYTAGLEAQAGQPATRERARAAAVAQQIAGRTNRKAGLDFALILDSGAVSQLVERSRRALALIVALREEGLWPPTVPAVVLVECRRGHAGPDANEPRFLKTCDIATALPSLSRAGQPSSGGWLAAARPSMRWSSHTRNPEAPYSHPIRTAWRRFRPTPPAC